MHRSHISFFSLLTVIFLAGWALLLTQSEVRAWGGPTDTTETCLACHPRSFAGEVHGWGTSNPVFKAAWDNANNSKECLTCHVTGYDAKTDTWKSDIIACEACHNPIPEDHPNQDMPVDRSNNLCGSCHNDTRFGWTDWKVSVHYKQNMTCSGCHDVHLPKRLPDENVSAYCVECHQDMTKRAEHSTHALVGVSCIDCHLGPSKGVDDYHKVPDHSFIPEVDTCNTCHAQQMHDPKPTPIVTSTVTPTVVVPTPTPLVMAATPTTQANPLSATPFSTMDFTFLGAGLLGLGAIGGLALSPVLDQINHFFSKPRK